ncbi:hypothetical protein [Paenibacillus sp. MBLB4367]|uniref:hypothetical protein n=1 Tax=Paenibacillus sp. MBLB4367 TaxID=3384767 RepID=UPI0039080BE6
MDKGTLHEQFTDLGLERIEHIEQSTYRLTISSDVTGTDYPLIVTTVTCEQGNTVVNFEEADFEGGEAVPLHVRRAALDKLIELELLFLDTAAKSLKEANNSSMAQDMDEMKKLGNEMKHMKTGSELLENNQIPDPMQ